MTQRVDVLGVNVSAINLQAAVDQIGRFIAEDRREYVCVTGVHGVIEAQDDPELLAIHNRAGIVTPDGMPLVWCSRFAGADRVDRVYGPDLLLETCDRSLAEGWSHYFYGAAPGVAQELASRLTRRYPGLLVAGTYSPPYHDLSSAEIEEVVDRINSAEPTIVWVGLSTPKQERWMSAMRKDLKAPILIGIGAAFDIHAGRLAQAPAWMQRSGLEWLFRLMVEPRRLWKRYLKANPAFVWKVMRRRPRLVEDTPG